MAQRAMIFLAILTAAAVAFAVVIATGGGPAVTVGAPLVDRSVFAATSIEIDPAGDAPPLRLALDDGRWIIASDEWPANEATVRAALRLLSEVAITGGGARASQNETRVSLGFDEGEPVELWIEPSARAVGGGAAIRDALGREGRAAIDLARAFEQASADAWRSPAAMPGVDIESSRVAMQRATGATSLARVGGRWFLREPVHAKADDRAVAALLGNIIDLRAARFGGEPVGTAPDAAGVVGVLVERDRRVPGADGAMTVETRRSSLRVLGAANADGTEILVEVDGVRLVVRAERLGALDVDAGELVARTTTTAAPADVGMIVLRRPGAPSDIAEIAFRRKVTTWDALGPAAIRLADPQEDSGGVERVLSFLAHAEADRVLLGPEAALGEPLGYVQLFSLSDEPLATIRVHRDPQGALTLVDESHPGVARSYAPAQTPPLLRAWLEGV